MTDQTLAVLIEKAISWELAARDLYVSLSGAFPSHPDVADLWKQMADDETYHASVLAETRNTLSNLRLAEPLRNEELAAIESVEAELRGAGSLAMRTLDDAYELAHRLESTEVNSVFRVIVSLHERDAETKALLNAQMDAHLERLIRLAQTYDRNARQGIAIEAS